MARVLWNTPWRGGCRNLRQQQRSGTPAIALTRAFSETTAELKRKSIDLSPQAPWSTEKQTLISVKDSQGGAIQLTGWRGCAETETLRSQFIDDS